MLGRKSKYEKRDYLKQFKIGKATDSESLIYEAYGGLQNDGRMLAVYLSLIHIWLAARCGKLLLIQHHVNILADIFQGRDVRLQGFQLSLIHIYHPGGQY